MKNHPLDVALALVIFLGAHLLGLLIDLTAPATASAHSISPNHRTSSKTRHYGANHPPAAHSRSAHRKTHTARVDDNGRDKIKTIEKTISGENSSKIQFN